MGSVKERVLSLCEKTNTKVGTLERVMALSNGTIKKWSEETVPNGQTLLSIANYFNVSVDYLLGRETPQIQSAAAHFDVATLTDEGREVYLNMVEMLAAKYSKSSK